MNTRHLAALAALVLSIPWMSSVPCAADGAGNIEAQFDSARLADDLSGTLTDPAKEIRVRFFASAGSSVSATLSPDPDAGNLSFVSGATLTLCTDAGTPIDLLPYDVSEPGTGEISLKKVPLTATTGYSFILRATGAGVWKLRLTGSLDPIKQSFASQADLAVGATTQVAFDGLRGGVVAFELKPTGKSKFRGELVKIERPDGSSYPDVPLTAKGNVTLDTDGVHQLVFRNDGNAIGAFSAKTTVKPPKLVKRRGYVRPEGTALVPVVTRVSPSSGYQKDEAVEVTLTGRDFQLGADVRLTRDDEADIVGTAVVIESEKTITCRFDLNTEPATGDKSLGSWKLQVWNAPVYAVPGNPSTLLKDSKTRSAPKTFTSVAGATITLPLGVLKETEVWQLDFNSDFQNDLDRMNLGSNDPRVRDDVRESVEAYVVAFLRDLMEANETTGKLTKNTSPAVSFVVGKIPVVAGHPGVEYNRIEIGGAWEAGDARDLTEPLLWGFAPLDPGNTHRDDLSIAPGEGEDPVRVGHGARTRVLDPDAVTANADWTQAMAPLGQNGLTALDRIYFTSGFSPISQAEANRYRDIVNQITRASREIAAVVAHHIGRAMGLSSPGTGPMAVPSDAGYLWPTTGGLAFSNSDLAALRGLAVPHELPGKAGTLRIGFFPLISTRPSPLPNATAGVDYAADWNFVGGRANARESDYRVTVRTSIKLLGELDSDFRRFTMKNTPVYLSTSQGLPYGGFAFLRVTASDELRGGGATFLYRLNVFPNFAQLPLSGIVFNRAVDIQNYINNN